MEEERKDYSLLCHFLFSFLFPSTSSGSCLLSSSHMNNKAFRLSHWRQKNKRQVGLKMAMQPWTEWQLPYDLLGVGGFPTPVAPHCLG